jgi:hypothetical protein
LAAPYRGQAETDFDRADQKQAGTDPPLAAAVQGSAPRCYDAHAQLLIRLRAGSYLVNKCEHNDSGGADLCRLLPSSRRYIRQPWY